MPDSQKAGGHDKIPGRISEIFDVQFEALEIDGRKLRVLAINNMPDYIEGLLRRKAIRDPLRDMPLWAKIWPSSFLLGRHLRHLAPEGKSLLELGCGMGAASLIASGYGFRKILATDINRLALDFTRANIAANNLDHLLQTRLVDVCSPPADLGLFDVIAASELLYLDELHRPLLKFLVRHLAPGGQALFCSDLARAKPRFQKLAAKSFNTREDKIGLKSRGEDGREERRVYTLLTLEKK